MTENGEKKKPFSAFKIESPIGQTKKPAGVNQRPPSHCSDESDRREPGKCRWIAPLHQLHGRSVTQIVELPMPNTSVKIALAFSVVLASPAASFARGPGGGGSAAMGHLGGVRPNAGQIGAALSQVTDPSGIRNANKVAPIPPPRISVPTIPQFK